jgi:hypothetical protein
MIKRKTPERRKFLNRTRTRHAVHPAVQLAVIVSENNRQTRRIRRHNRDRFLSSTIIIPWEIAALLEQASSSVNLKYSLLRDKTHSA